MVSRNGIFKNILRKRSLAASQPGLFLRFLANITKGFMKDCPTGKLSRNEFIRIYIQFFPHGNPSDFARFVFKTFDKDNDGTICFAEFIRAVSITSHGSLGWLIILNLVKSSKVFQLVFRG